MHHALWHRCRLCRLLAMFMIRKYKTVFRSFLFVIQIVQSVTLWKIFQRAELKLSAVLIE